MATSGKPRAAVYIDGFNLYYLLRSTPYKWLNVESLCKASFPNYEIARVNYYSAKVTGRVDDPDAPRRQSVYMRALRTLPLVQTTWGQFTSHPRWMPLFAPVAGGPTLARVWRTEEKGSDVNLATHLVRDACLGKYDRFVVVSNDTDLCEPMRIVRRELKKSVEVLHGVPRLARAIRDLSIKYKQFTTTDLAAHQLPSPLSYGGKAIQRPVRWEYTLDVAKQAAIGANVTIKLWRCSNAVANESGVLFDDWGLNGSKGLAITLPAGQDQISANLLVPHTVVNGRYRVRFEWNGESISRELDLT